MIVFRLIGLILAARRELWKIHRLDRGRAFVLTTLASGAFNLALAAFALVGIAALVAGGALVIATILALLTAWLAVPHWIVERVLVPRGWYRLAWALAHFDPRGDRARWPWLCAARAVARRGSPDTAVAWLLAREHTLDGTRLAAHAFLSHGRGDRADARALLRSLADVADPAPEARELAGEWLALDAAERGAWQEVVDAARAVAWPGRGRHRMPSAIDHARSGAADPAEPLWPATPLSYLLEGIAGRLLGRADAPSQLGVWFRWLLAPRRRATLPLVRSTLSPAPAPVPGSGSVPGSDSVSVPGSDSVSGSVPASASVPDSDPRTTAVLAHARALTDPRPATATATVAAWAAVVDTPRWPAAAVERALALGVAPDLAVAAATAARDQLVDALVELAVAARATTFAGSPLADAVAARARARILDGLELSLSRAHARIEAREALSALDEWRAFLALRAAYLDAAAAGGLDLERVAFPHADDAFGAWAVWLWNKRREYVASHAISAWLYERALAVGDAAAIELHGKNAALPLPD